MATGPVEKARAVRKALTPPEARLWVALKALRKEGYAFRRQAPVGEFFLDFACMGRRVAVEVDGRSTTRRTKSGSTGSGTESWRRSVL